MQLIGVLGVVAWVGVAGADPLDKPFAATPAELLAARAHLPASDASIVVLRDEAAIEFDDAGRVVKRYRVVFSVEKQAGADAWGALEVEWSPYYQDRPTVRARVIASPDQVAELEQKLVTDAPKVSESQNIFSDRRSLQVPLPRLAIGSIVEEEYTITDREALPAGSVDHERVGRGVPVQRSIVSISAPVARKLRVISRGFAKTPAPQQSTRGGRATWRFEIGAMPARPPRQPGTPSDITSWPEIGYASGPSWQAVATAYRQIVDKRIADGPFALPAELRNATVEKLVAWLHAHVRYTGIEVADAELVPWTPAEIVARGFGDCKDKATLLVALLRATGVPADVALLDTGPGLDVDPGLPGLGEFDHAIVRATVAGKDLWIDATEDGLPAGQLPVRDQGRRALIATPATADLVRTPTSNAGDNVIRKVSTFRAGEEGRASVTEVDTETGIYADNQRTWFRDTRTSDTTKALKTFATDHYEGRLVRFSGTDPVDLARPFALTVEINDSPRVFTKRDSLSIHLEPSDVLLRLPSVMEEEAAPTEPRTVDFVWTSPHVVEIETHVVLPPGYAPPALTPHEQQALGTMTLTTERRIDADALVISYRLDTGKLRLSPAELEATREAVRELRKHDGEHLDLAQTGARLMQQGAAKEAIAEYQRLIALHPKEALHYDQLADVYRKLGLGAAARRAARKGVEIQPSSSDAHDMLAWQLQHDTLGRTYGPDSDRKGSIAEYRNALALNPTHLGALADLATLLAHDKLGRPTTDRDDRREAIALWKRAKLASRNGDYDQTLATELLLAGELAEAEAAARALPNSAQRSVLLVAAVAAARGVAAAAQVAAGLDRAQSLRDAGGLLLLTRRYDLARALVAESGITDRFWTMVSARIAPVDLAKLDPADPKTVALQTFAVFLGRDVAPPAVNPGVIQDLVEQMTGFRDQLGPWRMFSSVVGEDAIVAISQPKVEGDAASGWHVVLEIGAGKLAYYIASLNHRAVLLGNADTPAELGRLVLGLLAKGDVAAAARWLGWFAADPHAPAGLRVAAKLYTSAAASAAGIPSKDALELVAAFLVAGKDPKLAAPILRRCAITGDVARTACTATLLDVLYALDRHAEIIELARTVPDGSPLWGLINASAARALVAAGDGAGGLALADQALAKHPDDHFLPYSRALVLLGAKGWPVAGPVFDALAASATADAELLNGAAWFHLYFDSTPSIARDLGARAEQLSSKHLSAGLANTLAAIEAEADRPVAAWAYLLKAVDAYGDRIPRESDWYVIGRIAESVGLRDDAIAAYRRVSPPKHFQIEPSSAMFAARGLARLGAH